MTGINHDRRQIVRNIYDHTHFVFSDGFFLIRNCLIAAGNSRDLSLLPRVTALLRDAAPLVRGMAVL